MAATTNGASRLGLWLSIAMSAGALLALIGAMFYVAFSTKANTDAIIEQRLTNDRAANERRELQLKLNTLEVALNEVETQFCAQDIVRNLMHASDLRTASILWDKAGLGRLPTDNSYYPTICNRRTK